MRCQRTVTSISVCSSMWPMCSTPVTLGGGMTSENTRPPAWVEARKMPESIHHCAQCGSNRWGTYNFSICMRNTNIATRPGDRHSRLKHLRRGGFQRVDGDIGLSQASIREEHQTVVRLR